MEGADPHTISKNFLRLPRLVHRLGKWSLCQYQIIYSLLISCIKFLGGNTQLEQDYWHQLLPSEGGLCLRGILFCFILCLSVLYWYIYMYLTFLSMGCYVTQRGWEILLCSNSFVQSFCIKFCLESVFCYILFF